MIYSGSKLASYNYLPDLNLMYVCVFVLVQMAGLHKGDGKWTSTLEGRECHTKKQLQKVL